jgi:CRP/FNR family transcriptional regulator, polysaccharide utilization system transcription regulator
MLERSINCDNCIDNPKSVFSVLLPEEKELIRKSHTCALFRKGEIIFKEGDKPTALICLSDGKVKVFKEGVGGREQIVRMAKPVSFIGYRALFAEENHTATAVAIEDSIVCIIDKDVVYRLLRVNSNLSLSIIKSFATELGFQITEQLHSPKNTYAGDWQNPLFFLKTHTGLKKMVKPSKFIFPGKTWQIFPI